MRLKIIAGQYSSLNGNLTFGRVGGEEEGGVPPHKKQIYVSCRPCCLGLPHKSQIVLNSPRVNPGGGIRGVGTI